MNLIRNGFENRLYKMSEDALAVDQLFSNNARHLQEEDLFVRMNQKKCLGKFQSLEIYAIFLNLIGMRLKQTNLS